MIKSWDEKLKYFLLTFQRRDFEIKMKNVF